MSSAAADQNLLLRASSGRSAGSPARAWGLRQSRSGGRLTDETLARLRQRLRAASYTTHGADLRRLFQRVDRDRSGSVELDEFKTAVRREAKVSVEQVSDADMERLFAAADVDGNGSIDVDEFVAFLMKDARHASPSTPYAASPLSQTSPRTAQSPSTRHRRGSQPGWGQHQRRRSSGQLSTGTLAKLRAKLRAAAYTSRGLDLHKLFHRIDRDRSGTVELAEFVAAVRKEARISPQEVSDWDLEQLFKAADEDNSGAIDTDEFVAFLNRVHHDPLSGRRQRRDSMRSAGASSAFSGTSTRSPLFRAGSSLRDLSGTSPGSPSRTWGKQQRRRGERLPPATLAKLRGKLRAAAYTSNGLDLRKLFRRIDRDRSGTIEFSEFKAAVRKEAKVSPLQVSEWDMEQLFAAADVDGSGSIDIDEFVTFLNQDGGEDGEYTPGGGRRRSMRRVSSRRSRSPRSGHAAPTPAQVDADLRAKLRAVSTLQGLSFVDIFTRYTDASGALALADFRRALRVEAAVTPLQLSDEAIEHVFRVADTDGNGAVDIEEFVAWVMGGDAEYDKLLRGAATSPVAQNHGPTTTLQTSEEVEYVIDITSLVFPAPATPAANSVAATAAAPAASPDSHPLEAQQQQQQQPRSGGQKQGQATALTAATYQRLQQWEQARKSKLERQRKARATHNVDELAECTFKPTLVSTPPRTVARDPKKSGADVVERLSDWARRKAARISRSQQAKDRADAEVCTFQPRLSKKASRGRMEKPAPIETGRSAPSTRGVDRFLARQKRARELAAERAQGAFSRSESSPDVARDGRSPQKGWDSTVSVPKRKPSSSPPPDRSPPGDGKPLPRTRSHRSARRSPTFVRERAFDRYSGDVASIVNSTTKPAGASATTPPAQPSANSVSPAVQGLARPSRPAPRRPNTNGERAVPPAAPYGRTDGEVGYHAGGAPSSPDAADAASWEESPPYRHHDAAFAQQLNSLDELLSGGPPPPPSAVESSGGVATPAPPARRAPVPPQSQESQPQTSPPPLLDASTNHAQAPATAGQASSQRHVTPGASPPVSQRGYVRSHQLDDARAAARAAMHR